MFFELKKSQEEFFYSGQTLDWNFRKEQLTKLKNLIYAHQQDFFDALAKDLNKSEFESIASELMNVAEEINLFCKKTPTWEKPKKVARAFATMDGQGTVHRKPYGTSLIIAPWNYPVQLALLPLVGAMGAGNCAILKPSEITPNVASLLQKIINDNFDSRYIHVVAGGVEESQALLSLDFDKIFFTGSPELGKIVMEKASKHLTDVTLELGGKSPVIIDVMSKSTLTKTLKRILWGKFLNGGQTCIAPDYILLPRTMENLFKEVYPQVMQLFETERRMHKIVNQRHFNRVTEHLNSGDILFGGNVDSATLSMELTVMVPHSLDSSVMKDEIFGPILPVVFYGSKEEALQTVRTVCEYPLALYVFSEQQIFTDYFLTNISFGGMSINDTISQILVHDLPFGGVKTSGVGAYHGEYSYECFSRKCGVFKKGFSFELPFRYPPYNKGIAVLKKIFHSHK